MTPSDVPGRFDRSQKLSRAALILIATATTLTLIGAAASAIAVHNEPVAYIDDGDHLANRHLKPRDAQAQELVISRRVGSTAVLPQSSGAIDTHTYSIRSAELGRSR